MSDKVIVTFVCNKKKIKTDLEVPTDITTIELLKALNFAFELGVDTSDIKQCFIKMENPIALMRGNRLVSDYKIRNGSVIYYG